jgi:hypothetical protein
MTVKALCPVGPVSHIKSDSHARAKLAENQGFSLEGLAQNGASESARHNAHRETRNRPTELGAAMNIAEAAQLLGCSAWTVRQRYMRQGLPCLRASAKGKLVFFHKQVIDWILKRQLLRKGGIPR